ncbi:ATP-binding protein [Paenibacillus sp. FA6]|uniref:ATP-binding protein n=1 Tax=Paenibacillus sp. FA6 TaxID=3413029 RepID=UPI003F65D5DB
MKFVPKIKAVIIVLIMISLVLISTNNGKVQQEKTMTITEWQNKWGSQVDLALWYKIQLSEMGWSAPALFVNKVYGHNTIVNTSDSPLYESQRMYDYKVNRAINPMKTNNSNELMYAGTAIDNGKVGIQDRQVLGNFSERISSFVNQDLIDVILGSSFIFVSVIMLICSTFLRKEFLSMWFSLSAVIFSIGILLMTYSSYLYISFGRNEKLFDIAFDCALFVLLPSLTFFFEETFGSGYRSIMKHFRRFQVGYSIICFMFLLMNQFWIDKYYEIYYFVSVEILGYTIIVQCLLLVITSIVYVVKGNKDALILSIGFTFIAGTALIEMVQFYSRSGNYTFFAWKWGVVAFIVVLIIVSGRRFAANHDQVVQYSKELELFNNELQRSEKIEIISELAASVAHEVRNPLQVTRGFLQLLMERYEQQKDREYLALALDELDRASNIITDFLIFAKPGFDRTTELNVRDELKHIEGILLPLANLSGGEIQVEIPPDLTIKGNSSKFKQALINLIKNSIEAWEGEGNIRIWAYQDHSVVSVHIQDNGEGMDQEELLRLGEPYFSNKTKGTGLGLMVSFRIIEVMQGEIHYKSQKGVGTEAIITFPSILE